MNDCKKLSLFAFAYTIVLYDNINPNKILTKGNIYETLELTRTMQNQLK
jgi:hypothetical protein